MAASLLVELVLAGVAALAAPTATFAAVNPGDSEAAAPAAPVTRDTLTATIDGILAHKRLADATISVVVADVASGEVLYSRNPDTAVNPASNIKLVTTAAALSLLGPEHRYVTRLFADKGARKGDTIDGDLYLRGGGDPWLVTADLYELASDLHALGIRKINGGIVVDASAFDRDELPPAFDQKEEFAAYRAMSSAAAVNFNTFVVHVRPGAAGQAATAVVDPPLPSVKVRSAITTTGGRRNQVTVEREASDSGQSLVFGGTIGADASIAHYRYPVDDPTNHAGEVLQIVLRERGIKVRKKAITAGTAPAAGEPLATHASPPLSTICRGINKLSNNFMAEQVLKSLDLGDEPASFTDAIAKVKGHLEGLGIPREGLRLTNGSGLYDANTITASQLVKLLTATYNDFRISADFLASLPISGADGTMRRRLKDGPAERYVRAKTGTLNEASALSGYAGAIGRPPLAFSILIGDISRGKTALARQVQNEIAEAVAAVAAAGSGSSTRAEGTAAAAAAE
ncbi:MAG: D-alanyl-D-alanine carboxypeptidase/D-alanyl-D-alanine-endopeptidase [Myxococcales bacterium]|nr:D-alanyl-D-alanine carboxypeptidase/D-alanyl-D-alanine-endopeptidase [Myxococcales bacterium]